MLCIFKSKFDIIKRVDMFGKQASLYIKGREKKKTTFGSIFSIIYIILYISFLIYKLKRMVSKKDVKFYDTFKYMEKPPSIRLSKNNFYGGFALEHPITYDPFIDESIYYPKAYFKRAHRNGEQFDFDVKELELERCKIEKFGKKFQDKIAHISINNLYCFKEMDELLEGHFSYNVYSFFYVEFFPCKNSTDDNKCKPIEEIDFYLNNTFLCFEMEDIQLTPENYKNPVLTRSQDIYFTVGKKLFQEVHVFFQIISIETDLDVIGFEQFNSYKTEQVLKYDSSVQMTNLLENDIYTTGQAFCSVTLKLSDMVRIQKRTYSNLIIVLGEIGGFMEFVFTLFKFFSSLITKILYRLTLVNELFKYNIRNKTIIMHYTKSNIKYEYTIDKSKHSSVSPSDRKMINNSLTPLSPNKSPNITILNYTDLLRLEKMKRYPKAKSSTILDFEKKEKAKKKYKKNKVTFKDNNMEFTFGKNNEKMYIIKDIKFRKIFSYFCLICFKKRKNFHNILLKEGIKLFMDKMDIISIFKKIIQDDKYYTNKDIIIEMSDECKKDLEYIDKTLSME